MVAMWMNLMKLITETCCPVSNPTLDPCPWQMSAVLYNAEIAPTQPATTAMTRTLALLPSGHTVRELYFFVYFQKFLVISVHFYQSRIHSVSSQKLQWPRYLQMHNFIDAARWPGLAGVSTRSLPTCNPANYLPTIYVVSSVVDSRLDIRAEFHLLSTHFLL